ncbi:MAG: DUF4124 domain-containing protein [Gammaproteobacteria bacterium]|nr:DUF4124 domain-containing protein [Gammaproteobacteria bacterium]
MENILDMKKVGLLILLLSCASLAQADLYQSTQTDGTVSYSDRIPTLVDGERHDTAITNPMSADQLPGIWHASDYDGNDAELTLRDDMTFVFNQTGDKTRVFMCGTWIPTVDALGLTVKALKRQLESGETEQADRVYQDAATILSAQRDRMILVINGQELVFDRAG